LTIAINVLIGLLTQCIVPCVIPQTAPTPASGAAEKPAEQSPAASAVPPPPPPPSPWTKNGIDIYLYGDVYGDINFNHPAASVNQLYNFNVVANQARLSFAKVALEKTSGILGFRVDAGYGNSTLNTISAIDPAPSGFKYLEQFYVEFRPPKAHGMQIDLGKFVTSVGAEVIEAGNNWNYSRPLVFAIGSPYYHFGGRATIPVSKELTVGVQLVNGWNSVGDQNTFETVGLVGSYAWKKVTWNHVYMTGPQTEGGVRARLQVYDTNVAITPNSKTNAYIELNVGSNKLPDTYRQDWVGIAAAARYQLTPRFAVAGRFEWFNDLDGFSSGAAQHIVEGTITGEMKIVNGLKTRIEYRRDSSDQPYFDRGAGVMVAKAQSTLTLGLIASFGPK
jgi:Putative beta-barrel porin-2, OmpL-like. bbp2